jgi:CDP-ribitol ribitolphosphotransferase
VSTLEYRLASAVLRILGRLFGLLPAHPGRVVLATARLDVLEGNLLAIHDAIRRLRPGTDVVLLLEPYGYGLASKLRYLARTVRGTYHVRTAGLVVVDNAYLPVHVAPHPARTTVVQVWHAAGALKRFGLDTAVPPADPERTFLHRHYDVVVTSGEASRQPWSRALRTPVDRVLPLGTPRTDALLDPAAISAARARVLAAHPGLAGRRVLLWAPTFRGRGRDRTGAAGLDGQRLRGLLPAGDWVLAIKTHPNVDPAVQPTGGFDVVARPDDDLNDWLAIADVLLTDYSSSIFEWALLRRPLVLLVDDLEAYGRDPGLYVDYACGMIGTQVRDTDGAAAAILEGAVDAVAWDRFLALHMGACDGRAAERFVERFLPTGPRA